jgi:glycosyltransferase involved in cell wall biosynthesis
MKKVAIVTYSLNVGGMETFVLGLARQLKEKGLEPSFVITDSIGPWHGRPLAEGFAVHTVIPSLLQSRTKHAERVAACLESFDFVLLNHSKIAQSSLGLLSDTIVVIPILHNDDNEIYTVGLANRENIDVAVAVSEHLRNKAISYGMDDEMIVCIRNGVEIPLALKNKSLMLTDKPLSIAFIGRIEHRQKGVFYLPGILSKLAALNIFVQCDIVGNGVDFEQLKRMFAAEVNPSTVRFHGALHNDEAMNLLQSIDVLLMPSHFEGQGLVMLEAMSRGVVPIVSNLKDVTDSVIQDGENGMLVSVGDIEGFAAALAIVASDRHRLAVMSTAARQTAVDEFSIETMAQNYWERMSVCAEKRQSGRMPKRTREIDSRLLGRFPNCPSGINSILSYLKTAIHRRIGQSSHTSRQ